MSLDKPIDVEKLRREAEVKEVKSTPLVLDDAFVEEHMPIVEAMAANIIGAGKTPPGIAFDDLVSWGTEGLLKAHSRYDDSKGTTFKTYAYYRIRGEMFDRIRNEWRYRNSADYDAYKQEIKEKIADIAEEALNDVENNCTPQQYEEGIQRIASTSGVVCLMSLDNIEVASTSDGIKNPEVEFIDDNKDALWDKIGELDELNQNIVKLFYVEGLKQKEIAAKLNMSRSSVCRLHMKILEKLKRNLKEEDFF